MPELRNNLDTAVTNVSVQEDRQHFTVRIDLMDDTHYQLIVPAGCRVKYLSNDLHNLAEALTRYPEYHAT